MLQVNMGGLFFKTKSLYIKDLALRLIESILYIGSVFSEQYLNQLLPLLFGQIRQELACLRHHLTLRYHPRPRHHQLQWKDQV